MSDAERLLDLVREELSRMEDKIKTLIMIVEECQKRLEDE